MDDYTEITSAIGALAVHTDARASASITAWHWIDDAALGATAVWVVQRNNRWRIAALTRARAWAEGNKDLPQLAGEPAREWKVAMKAVTQRVAHSPMANSRDSGHPSNWECGRRAGVLAGRHDFEIAEDYTKEL